MKHYFTVLFALATSLTAFAQPDCSQIIQAAFTSTVQGNIVVVTNTSASQFPQATTYVWYFGDGSASDGNIVTHVYDTPGTYLLCLYASVENCLDSVCQEVVIGGGDPCLALADVVTTLVPQQGGVSFAYANVPQYANTMWYFGDGTSSGDDQGFHQYQEPGTYTVCLWTWFIVEGTTDTCSTETCLPVTIEGGQEPCDALQAGFFPNVLPGAVQFSNATTGTGFQTTWNWSFGDGTTSNDAQPLHEYDQPGEYLVCLTAISIYEQQGGGVITCVDSTCQEVTAPGEGSPCDLLSADFNVSVQGTMAMIDNAVSSNEYTYIWDFGDGTEGYGPDPAHTYSGPGTYQICLLMWGWDPFTQDTCFADHCEWITIGGGDPCGGLQAGFFANASPNGVQFSNGTTGTGFSTTWSWTFGDGTSSNDAQPFHEYPGPGNYLVCLTAVSIYEQNGGGVITCVDSVCQEVEIPGEGTPCEDLNAAFNPVAGGLSVNIQNAQVEPGWSYVWDFGDGTVGDGPGPFHVYDQPGEYQICLIVGTYDPIEQDSCFADNCVWITIGGGDPCAGLQAGFLANVGDATVWFSNTTVGTGFQTTWYWDFGDGTTSNDAQPSHIFPDLGTYEVCLTVTSIFEQQGGGVITCQDSSCQIVVTGGSSPCDSLIAEFVVTTQENLAAFTTFGGTAFGYQWNFGDGTQGDGPAPTHIYPGPGAYHACLITWTWDPQTQDTCYADQCQWVIIGGGNPCDTIQSCFTWEGSQATLFFDNCSSMNGMGPWYLWDFGDGTQSDAISPTHTFPGPGTYTVCLTGWLPNSPDSCTSTVCHEVIIEGGGGSPCDSLSADFTVTGIETQAVFTGFGGTAIGYHWTFGDGTQGDGANPVHVYPGPGNYQACLVTWTWDPQTQDTCYAEHCEWITIGSGTPCDSLEAHFVWEPVGPNVYLFQDASETNGQDVSYWWSFGDGTYADGPNPDHVFQQPGEYTVCLTITALNAPDSCTSTTCQTIIVQGGGSACDSLWTASFEFEQQGNVYTFYNTSNTQGTVVSTQWTFGDGSSGDGSQLVHTYAASGNYTVCMTISGIIPGMNDSCQVEICQNIEVSVGIEDPYGSSPVHAWPLPFDGALQLEGADLLGNTRYTLFDMTGRMIDDRSALAQGRMTLEYTHLPPGTYVLRLRNALVDRSLRVMKR